MLYLRTSFLFLKCSSHYSDITSTRTDGEMNGIVIVCYEICKSRNLAVNCRQNQFNHNGDNSCKNWHNTAILALFWNMIPKIEMYRWADFLSYIFEFKQYNFVYCGKIRLLGLSDLTLLPLKYDSLSECTKKGVRWNVKIFISFCIMTDPSFSIKQSYRSHDNSDWDK